MEGNKKKKRAPKPKAHKHEGQTNLTEQSNADLQTEGDKAENER